jgi:hypothetical protein
LFGWLTGGNGGLARRLHHNHDRSLRRLPNAAIPNMRAEGDGTIKTTGARAIC